MTQTYSSILSDIRLPDPDDQETRLGDLWQKGPAVVAFLRHYG